MELDGFLDVGVPEVPGVVAGEFVVLVCDAVVVEELDVLSGLREEPVLGAVGELERGEESLLLALFGEGEEVEGAAGGIGAAHGVEFGLSSRGAGDVAFVAVGEASGEAVDGAVASGVAHGEPEGAVAAHGESADGASGGVGSGVEGVFDEVGEFLSDVGSPGGAVEVVGIEATSAVGHDDDEGEVTDIPFDAGVPHPDGVVVGESVEEVEDGEGALSRLGDDGPGGDGLAEDLAFPVQFAEAHGGGGGC